MKSLIAASAALALFAAAPAFADSTDANSTGGKPSTGAQTGTTPAAKNMKADESTGSSGSSTGSSGMSKDMPGASDSKKTDSSLSTNGNKPKQ
jgi:hypothetical protein